MLILLALFKVLESVTLKSFAKPRVFSCTEATGIGILFARAFLNQNETVSSRSFYPLFSKIFLFALISCEYFVFFSNPSQ